MSFTVLISESAERELRTLPREIARRVILRITALADLPIPPTSKKLTGRSKEWRIRVGDYRVLYNVDESESVIRVWRIRHRKDAYR